MRIYSRYKPKVPVNPIEFAETSKRNLWIIEKGMKAFSFFNDHLSVGEIDIVIDSPISYIERFQRTVLDGFYRVAFSTKVYRSIEELQEDLDLWLRQYNDELPHSGKYCYGKPPRQTFLDANPMTRGKIIGRADGMRSTEGGC